MWNSYNTELRKDPTKAHKEFSMNSFLLWIVKALNPFWRRMGADLDQLYAIINAKLKMDDRRKSPMYSGGKGKKKDSSQQWFILMMNFFMGLLMASLLFQFNHTPTGLTIYFAAWMVLLSMTMVTDFSDVLLDTKDNYILLPTPISDKTISISRIVHIMLYLFRQVIAYVLPAIIYFGFANRAGLIVFLIQSVLVVILTVFLVNALYMLVMKYSSPERFNNIINNLQIVFTIVIFGAYYLLPELVDVANAAEANIFSSPFSYLAPPAWIAAIWELTINADFSIKIILHSAMAFLATGGAFVFVSKYLSRDFNQRLLSIGQAKGSSKTPEKIKTEKPNRWTDWLADVLTYNKVENAAFKFCMQFIGRDRMYKLKTYPALGYIPIMFFGLFMRGRGTLAERIAEMQAGDQYLFLIYICAFMGITPLTNAIYSDKPGQTWIFRATPVAHPKPIFTGMFKAIFIQFLVPVWSLMFVLSVWFWGPKVVDDFLLGGLILFALSLIICRRSFDYLPFSKPWNEMEKGSNMAKFFMITMGLGLVGGLHYWFLDNPLVLGGIALLTILASSFTWWSFKNLTWDKINS